MTRALFETNRPKSLDDFAGQKKAVALVQRLIDADGLAGRAFWISGNSGTGKTTLARIMAESIADPFLIEEIDAGELTPARLREVERTMGTYGMGKPGRVLIVNEAHGLRKDTIRALLVMLERIPSHAMIVFTTTRDGMEALFEDAIDAGPLLSRCLRIGLTNQGLAKALAPVLKSGAERAGLDGMPVESYAKLMQRRDIKNNIRAAWQAIEGGCMLA